MLQKTRLLTPASPNCATAIINGTASGIVNWNDIKYPQFYEIYRCLLLNYWIPDEISMSNDKKDWLKLTEKEQKAFKRIIGLLATLDSVQTRYILEASVYVSDPSVHAILAIIAGQEVIHNQSYSYVLSSLVNIDEQNAVFDEAKNDPNVQQRNQFIIDLYEEFRKKPGAAALAKSLVGSIILEGINFYSGFAYFYNLARHQVMVSTSTMISYIQRDEMQHCYFISMLLRAILTENPEIDANGEFTQFLIVTFKKAVQAETNWSRNVLADIDGIQLKEIEDYIKYLANKRFSMLGLGELYEGYSENVMPWIRTYSDESMNTTKTDFFEQRARTYTKVGTNNGFDEL